MMKDTAQIPVLICVKFVQFVIKYFCVKIRFTYPETLAIIP